MRHFELTGKLDATCMYRSSASMLGRLYKLYSERVVFLLSGVWCSSSSLFGIRAKRHSFEISFSIHPVRMSLLSDDNTVTSCLANNTVQSASHMGSTTTIVLVKDVMMYRVDCKIGSVEVNANLSTCSVAVPKLIFGEFVLGGPCKAVGAM